MAIVETIFVRLRTRDAPKAGTDASVYVGIGGREFRIDSRDPDFDDFERNDDRTYILGKKPNVLPSPNPEYIGRSFIGMGDPDVSFQLGIAQIFWRKQEKSIAKNPATIAPGSDLSVLRSRL